MIIANTLYSKQDSAGNLLYVKFVPVDGDLVARVVLKLAAENRTRSIGVITKNSGEQTLHVNRSTEKHFHYKAKGFGFNAEVLNEKIMFSIDKIHLCIDKKEDYLIPKHVFDEHGFYLHFKKESFELQRFINIKFIEPYKKQ